MKNKFLKNLYDMVKIFGSFYIFLSICNWDYNIANWNGLSHFLSACSVLVILSIVFDEKIID